MEKSLQELIVEFNKYNFKEDEGMDLPTIHADALERGEEIEDTIDTFEDYVKANLESSIDKMFVKFKEDYSEDYNDTIDLSSSDLADTFYSIVRDVYAAEEEEETSEE